MTVREEKERRIKVEAFSLTAVTEDDVEDEVKVELVERCLHTCITWDVVVLYLYICFVLFCFVEQSSGKRVIVVTQEARLSSGRSSLQLINNLLMTAFGLD